jgi:hypothetical protein
MLATSIDALVAQLRNPEMKQLTASYFSGSFPEIGSAIFASVDKSTIRAYRNTRIYRPLSIYRSWALREFANGIDQRLNAAARGIEQYRQLHGELCERLRAYWSSVEATTACDIDPAASSVPNYGRARKLVDLLMKHVLLVSELSSPVRKTLKSLIHVPLDHYTLKHLSGLSHLKGISLPRSRWTMGYASEATYLPLQDLIREVCERAGVDPIDFDIYAWNAEPRHLNVRPQGVYSSPSQLNLIARADSAPKDMRWYGRRLRAQKRQSPADSDTV